MFCISEPHLNGDLDLDVNFDPEVFLPPSQARSFMHMKEKRRASWRQASHGYQGIVCECCYNKCDIYEMHQYCAGHKEDWVDTQSIYQQNSNTLYPKVRKQRKPRWHRYNLQSMRMRKQRPTPRLTFWHSG